MNKIKKLFSKWKMNYKYDKRIDLYRKEYEEQGVNIMTYSLYLPIIFIGKKKNEYGNKFFISKFEFPTKIYIDYDKSYYSWSITIILLGFGFGLYRQNGY